MKHSLKDYESLTKIYLWMIVIPIGLWGIGVITMLILGQVSGPEDRFPFGISLGIFGLFVMMLMMATKQYTQEFNLFISMGRTRKEFFASHFIANTVSGWLLVWILFLLCFCEVYLYQALDPKASAESLSLMEMTRMFSMWWLWLAGIAISIISMLFGILFNKFGMKLYWGCWFAIMVMIFLMPRLFSLIVKSPAGGRIREIVEWLVSLSQTQWLILTGCILAVLLMICAVMIRKQEVAD